MERALELNDPGRAALATSLIVSGFTISKIGAQLAVSGLLGSAQLPTTLERLTSGLVLITYTMEGLTLLNETLCSEGSDIPLKKRALAAALSMFSNDEGIDQIKGCLNNYLESLGEVGGGVGFLAEFLQNTLDITDATLRAGALKYLNELGHGQQVTLTVGKDYKLPLSSLKTMGQSILLGMIVDLSLDYVATSEGFFSYSRNFHKMTELNHTYASLMRSVLSKIVELRQDIDWRAMSFEEFYDTLAQYEFYVNLYMALYVEQLNNQLLYLSKINASPIGRFTIIDNDGLQQYKESLTELAAWRDGMKDTATRWTVTLENILPSSY